MDTTSKEESEQFEPEIQALQDEGSGTIDDDDEDEIEELHKSLKEVVKDPYVKPKLQCLMVDQSFSMVTVQSEDSGIVWETASSRCSTPWASEASSPSDSLESSGAQGKITIIMDEDKIVRKRKRTGRSRLGDRLKRPSSRTAAYGTERPAMAEVSVPNVRPENDKSSEVKLDKDQELFSLISEGYEILNIVVPSKLPTVDEEETSDLVDNLSFLQHTPKIKSRCKPAAAPAGIIEMNAQEIDDREKAQADKDASEALKQAKKERPDVDYLEKFTMVDSHVPSEQLSLSEVPEQDDIIQEPEHLKPQEESKPEPSPSGIEESFVIITDDDIASEHLDEVFYANTGCMAEEDAEEDDSGGGLKDAPRSLKESGSVLFGSQETILIPVFLPEGPPKIIDQCLLEEPRAMSFLYTDLYDEAMGVRGRDDDHSDVESTVSEKSYKRRFSEDEDEEGYLERFILKDETPSAEDPPEVTDDTEAGRIIWPQNKFELTGCLKRVKEVDDSGEDKTEIPPTEQMTESEKAQPEDTGKQEKVSQEPITEATDESKIEQEKEGDTEVCVGNHCRPCDSEKVIHESPGCVIQKDFRSSILEERAETVSEIRKHDDIPEKVKDSKETPGETKDISGTILKKSPDVPNEVYQKSESEEVMKDTIKEPVNSQDLKTSSPEDVSEKTSETPIIIEEPSVKKMEEVTEIQSDTKISKEPVKEDTEVKKSDEIVAEQARPDIKSQVEVEESVIRKEEPTVPIAKSKVIVTAPEAIKVSEDVQPPSAVSAEQHRTDGISQVPNEVAGGSKDIISQKKKDNSTLAAVIIKEEDVIKCVPEVETEDLKPDTTEQEEVTDTLLDEKSEAIEKTVKDDNLISVAKDTMDASEPQLSVEFPQSEVQEQVDAIQEQELDKPVEKMSEASELLQGISPALQVNAEVISAGPEPEKGEEMNHATETPVEKIQYLTESEELVDETEEKNENSEASNEMATVLQVNTDIVCDAHEPKQVEDKQSTVILSPSNIETIDLVVANREKLAEAGVTITKHVVKQAQRITGKEAVVPIIEVFLGKVPLPLDMATENQLPTSKPEMPPVASGLKESEEPVTRTTEGVTSVQKDLKQEVLPETDAESDKEAVQQSEEAELEKVKPEVRELQALDKPKVEVDVMPEKVNEESIVPTEAGGDSRIEVTQDDIKAAVDKLDSVKPDIAVSDKIVSDAVAEIPSVETPGSEVVSAETKVPDKTVSCVEAEIPSVKTPDEVVTVENKVSDTTVDDEVAEIPLVETRNEFLIVENRVSDKTDMVAEIPSVETPGPEVVTVEKVSDKTFSCVGAEIPSVEKPDEVVTVEKVSDETVTDAVAELPSVETPGPKVVTVENKVSDKTVNDVVAEITLVEIPGPEVVSAETKVSDKTVSCVGAEIPLVEKPDEVVTVEKVSDKTVNDAEAEIPSVETPGPEVVTEENKVSDKTVNNAVAEIPSVEIPGPEVVTVENKVSDTIVDDVVAELPSVETPGPEVVTEENKVSDKTVNDAVAEIPSVEIPGPEVVTVENKVSDTIVDNVVAELPSVETPGPEVVTEENKVSDKTVNDVVAEIPLVEIPGPEVVSAETKVSDKTVSCVGAEIPSVETPDEVVTAENKVSDTTVDDVAEIPSVEKPNEVLIVENKVSDKTDMVAEIPSVEIPGPEVVTEEEVSDKTVTDAVAEIPSVETFGPEVVTVENKAVRTPSPSAAPALVKVEEVTTEDRKEGEPEGPVFSPLRSFSPQEDLSVLPEPECLKDPEYHDETAEELGYEIVTPQEAREYPGVETEVIPEEEEDEHLAEGDTSKVLEEEAAEDVLEADYEIIEASESIQLSEEDQAKMQLLDTFCLVCQCPVMMMEEHQNHDVCRLDKAHEDLKDRLSNRISTLQERSENIEDMVSEIELAYNSVEEHCKTNEQAMDDQNEEMLKLVMDQYNEMSNAMEEEKKAKLEKLYDQIVSFQESIDAAKEMLEKNLSLEDESDPFMFVISSKDINMSLAKALESTMSLELGPRGLSVFDDYAKGSGNGQKHRKGIPVPQKPHLQPQEANSATTNSVTVYWTVNEGDIIDCFQVYCMEDPQGAISEEYRVTVKESYCTLEELDPDKSYKVWVMAVNYTGCSLASERLSFKTAPSVPVIQPKECTVLWDSATLRWTTEQPSAAESFTLEYCRQYACEGEGLRSISGIKGYEQRVLLQPNENYLFYIKAVNSAGASEQSEAALISTRGQPVTPTPLYMYQKLYKRDLPEIKCRP
ncbi:cardiomyopathy-associated protein 5 isoform X1 [Clupea harengus]|uniref:Cardiomyopathy-associated protein 5 isoform X1 n=1 Tax=Clupea harengus TaxID=7950 RepID=A0A8M1KL55_CLUHA|nr:cardiomyopathy-associated protein 5 isoform X1 [Clupea harengus]